MARVLGPGPGAGELDSVGVHHLGPVVPALEGPCAARHRHGGLGGIGGGDRRALGRVGRGRQQRRDLSGEVAAVRAGRELVLDGMARVLCPRPGPGELDSVGVHHLGPVVPSGEGPGSDAVGDREVAHDRGVDGRALRRVALGREVPHDLLGKLAPRLDRGGVRGELISHGVARVLGPRPGAGELDPVGGDLLLGRIPAGEGPGPGPVPDGLRVDFGGLRQAALRGGAGRGQQLGHALGKQAAGVGGRLVGRELVGDRALLVPRPFPGAGEGHAALARDLRRVGGPALEGPGAPDPVDALGHRLEVSRGGVDGRAEVGRPVLGLLLFHAVGQGRALVCGLEPVRDVNLVGLEGPLARELDTAGRHRHPGAGVLSCDLPSEERPGTVVVRDRLEPGGRLDERPLGGGCGLGGQRGAALARGGQLAAAVDHVEAIGDVMPQGVHAPPMRVQRHHAALLIGEVAHEGGVVVALPGARRLLGAPAVELVAGALELVGRELLLHAVGERLVGHLAGHLARGRARVECDLVGVGDPCGLDPDGPDARVAADELGVGGLPVDRLGGVAVAVDPGAPLIEVVARLHELGLVVARAVGEQAGRVEGHLARVERGPAVVGSAV